MASAGAQIKMPLPVGGGTRLDLVLRRWRWRVSARHQTQVRHSAPQRYNGKARPTPPPGLSVRSVWRRAKPLRGRGYQIYVADQLPFHRLSTRLP